MGQFTESNKSYAVDICLVIDKTASMEPLIDTVKENALRLHTDIAAAMKAKDKELSDLRIRVLCYGDYKEDGASAFYGCDFLKMPEQNELLKQCVNSIKAEGGGDIPEDGLEALAFAIRSNWVQCEGKRRHIICVFTDASCHDLGFGKDVPGYPEDAPRDFDELTRMWGHGQYRGEMDQSAKRLLLFAPDESYWKKIRRGWNNCVLRIPQELGLQDVTYSEMLNTIANSI